MQSHINGSFGVAVGLGLLLIGVPDAVLWGLLAAALRFIPYVGLAVSTLLPIALSLSLFPGWVRQLLVIGLIVPLELSIYRVLEPLLYGQSVGVSAVGAACGDRLLEVAVRPVGLLLATPLISAIRNHAQDALTDEDVQFVVWATRAIVEDLKMRQPKGCMLPADPPELMVGEACARQLPLGGERSPEEAERAAEDQPDGSVLHGGVLEKTRKDYTREELWARVHTRCGSQDNRPSVQNLSIAIGESLLFYSPSVFGRNLGNVTAFHAERD
jgi:AI-2E family transporter